MTITVIGRPAPQGSKRAFVRGGKAILVEASERSRPWRSEVQAAMQACREKDGMEIFGRGVPLTVNMCVGVKRPAGHFGTGKNSGKLKQSAPGWPTGPPDLDKVARTVGDAGNGIWWHDDSQIVTWEICRKYTPRDEVWISVCRLVEWTISSDYPI